MALDEAKKLGLHELQVNLDSEPVVRQLNQEYKIKNAELGKLFVKIWNVLQQFQRVRFRYVPREQNREADRLVNEAIDQSGR